MLDDASRPGAATAASAGMLAPLAEAAMDDRALALNVRARDLYFDLVPELEESTGADLDHWSGGIVQAVFEDEEAAAVRSRIARLRQLGFAAEWLSPDALGERCPGLAPEVVGAMLAPEDGVVNPATLRTALLDDAIQHGAVVQHGKVTRLRLAGTEVTGVDLGSDAVDAGAVVIAAGCWSGTIETLPRPISVEPIKGEMISMAWPADEPRTVVYGGGGYVLQRGGEALIGATMEYVGFDAALTEPAVDYMKRVAARLFPTLGEATVEHRWVGLRPATPDGNPIIGRDPTCQNLWYATGHGRNGILLAGFTGVIIARQYCDEPEEEGLDLSSVDPARFWSW